jgi:MFS family permease
MVSLLGMPYAVLMPIFADQILHVGARGLGILMGASGFGAFLAALLLAWRLGVKGLGTWVAWASGGLGVGLIGFAYSRVFPLSIAFLVVIGFSMMMQMTASNTLIQSMVPDRLRGRVMSVYAMMFMGMAPVGALTAGALANRFNAPLTLAIGGAVCMIGAAIFSMQLPSLRGPARELIFAQSMSGGAPPDGVAVSGDR